MPQHTKQGYSLLPISFKGGLFAFAPPLPPLPTGSGARCEWPGAIFVSLMHQFGEEPWREACGSGRKEDVSVTPIDKGHCRCYTFYRPFGRISIMPQHPLNRHGAKAARLNSANDDKEAEIFAAAVRIFRQKGYHAASMQDLADAVGLQKASLYYYVSSKEDLLLSIYERLAGAFTRQLTELIAAPLSPSDKLRRAVESQVVALGEQLELFTVYLSEQKFLNGRPRERIRAEAERHAELIESILNEGIEAHVFRECNVTVTARAIIGMCNWLYQWYSPEGRLTPREIAEIFGDLVLDGVESPPGPSPKRSRRPDRRHC